ncbi:MAG: hypothetical protein ACLFXM_01635 [Acidimicrobiia bacterium]
MVRLRRSPERGGAGPPADTWPPGPVDVEAELVDNRTPATERYAVGPVHPVGQLAARIALWGAVAVGCLGAVVGFVRPPVEVVEPAAEHVDESLVPAPVAGAAEIAVEAWLTATADERERLEELFVDDVSFSDHHVETLAVGDATTVGGRRVDEGYWSVVVAVAVVEEVPPGAEPTQSSGDGPGHGVGDDRGQDDGAARRASRWFVEVGVVGGADDGFAALTTPAILPGPPPTPDGWVHGGPDERRPDPDDTVVSTVEGFLGALLTGDGDPLRYLAPGGSVTVAENPPFAELAVMDLTVEDIDDTTARAWTRVQVTTPGGARRVAAYEVLVVERVDRWEILELSGVPTTVEPPAREGSPPAAGSSEPA